jgi:undecaprenyl-diphosphatase
VTRRSLELSVSLLLLIVIGVGLRRAATLMSGEDLSVVRGLVADRTGLLTTLARAVSWLGRSAVLVPAAAAAALAGLLFRRQLQWAGLLVGVIGAVIIQNVDKALIGRPRPAVVRLVHVGGTSFPSGHATEASAFFVLALILIFRASRSTPVRLTAGVVAVTLIASVALSRVYLGVHYPTDVAAGILLGGAWSLIVAVGGLPQGTPPCR